MRATRIHFTVTALEASVPEGIPLTWQGREIDSGPLVIELQRGLDGEGNRGTLDYLCRRARAEFRVRLSFPELEEALLDLGVDPSLTIPIHAVLRSEGEILENHGFRLSGRCELAPHALFPQDECAASVLPGT